MSNPTCQNPRCSNPSRYARTRLVSAECPIYLCANCFKEIVWEIPLSISYEEYQARMNAAARVILQDKYLVDDELSDVI